MVRKFFNIKCKTEDTTLQRDGFACRGSDLEYRSRSSLSEREACTIKKSRTEKFSRKSDQVRRARMNLDHPRIIDVHNYRYVGAEDNGPAKKWLALIGNTLNNLPGTSGGNGYYTPSPIPQPVVELNADFEGSARQKNSSFFHRRSFQTTSSSWGMDNDPSTAQPRLDRRFSVCDRVIFGNRKSDFDPSLRWGYRPSDYSRASDYSRPSDYYSRASDYSRTSDYYSRASDYSRPSDYSRWGSSDDDNGLGDSPSTVLFSPMSYGGPAASGEDGYSMPGRSKYSLVASKQMVGIFLTVWVRGELKDHVKNMKVSCVGRGLMGYLGNKGSISISMSLHETSFCFICSHLTSGQKEGDELRRNSDVLEILKKTRFPRVHGSDNEKSPETILEHDRIIWLGDLNYRIALNYRSAKALIEMQNWRALLENDQLRIEQKRGRAFAGWKEGKIYFPPTYKYSTNSDRYAGDDMHPKEKRRTPAWCDRILWHGEDHRPVYGMFWAEVESKHGKLKKSMSCSRSRIQVEELLPYSHGYTELNFF
ncbi:hypothetical protein TSUD_228730 [Trifolium subterraneum]|uniref:Inositol polyphosphate-related phosphatase domain-containing protein n=1 Tax=Trifolium subterraneum TaxID=3900 RepID=A0A2Z6M9U2_TRISU|nr:hypothetical protein TSUD_228730 [Trifolium subterraneum]